MSRIPTPGKPGRVNKPANKNRKLPVIQRLIARGSTKPKKKSK